MNRWLEMDTPSCNITIEPRIAHCTRGRYIAKVFPRGNQCEVNEQSGWPRYYFDLRAALNECELWLEAHGVKPVPWHKRELKPGACETAHHGVVQSIEQTEMFLSHEPQEPKEA